MSGMDAANDAGLVFRPWIGEHYSTSGLGGLRLLIIGESHYGEPDDGTPLQEYTNVVIRGHIDDPTRNRFFGRVEQFVASDPCHGTTARADFWGRVMFCNLVQRVLKTRQDRPTPTDWGEGRRALVPLLREHLPDAVLVLGAECWNQGLSGPGFVGSQPICGSPRPLVFEWQIAPAHTAIATWIYHPTGARGFPDAERSARVKDLIMRVRLKATEASR